MEIFENLLESEPDVLIVHTGANYFPKNINPLNNLKKVHQKCLDLSPEAKLVFSNILLKKKTNLDQLRKDMIARMKNFCKQIDRLA